MNNLAQEKKYKKIITALSVIIPVAVAALFGVNLRRLGFDVAPLKFLPQIYASINGFTAVLLIAAVISKKKGNKKLH
jgi:putative membrane protein